MTVIPTAAGASPLSEDLDGPLLERVSNERQETSPLWPLVVLLSEIAIRVEREHTAEEPASPPAAELPQDAA